MLPMTMKISATEDINKNKIFPCREGQFLWGLDNNNCNKHAQDPDLFVIQYSSLYDNLGQAFSAECNSPPLYYY